MERWDPSQVGDLVALTDAALPGEDLGADELAAVCWEGGEPLVLGLPGGEGAVAGVVREDDRRRRAFVHLVVVRPEARRRGHGRALVDAFVRWALDEQDAAVVAVGRAAPFYLWPGVDVHATGALCLFEAAGFVPTGAELNLAFPASHRAPTPPGVEVVRVLDEGEVEAASAFVARHWPHWSAEAGRAIEQGTCHVVRERADGTVTGFACHSVNRLGWLGPMGTDPARRARGMGNLLLAAVATDLRAAGRESVEVSWVGPVGFYAKAAGATVSRAFRTLELRRGPVPGPA